MYWFNLIWIISCFGLAILSTIFWISMDSLCSKITGNGNSRGSYICCMSMVISYITLIVALFAPYNNFFNWNK